jgi:hypothetical protein
MNFFAELIKDLQATADNQPQYCIHCEIGNRIYSGTPESAVERAKNVCDPEQYILWGITHPLHNRTMFVWFNGSTDCHQYEVSWNK